MIKSELILRILVEFYSVFPEVADIKPHIIFRSEEAMPWVFQRERYAHGFCDHGDKLIVINEDWFLSANYYHKKKVLFHELGHCVLDMRHPQDLTDTTIMNITLSTAEADGSNWYELVHELRERYNNEEL